MPFGNLSFRPNVTTSLPITIVKYGQLTRVTFSFRIKR